MSGAAKSKEIRPPAGSGGGWMRLLVPSTPCIMGLAVFAAICLAPDAGRPLSFDTFLHVYMGEHMLLEGERVDTDPSCWAVDRRYLDHEWLPQLALGAFHSGLGLEGLVLLTALMAGLVYGLVAAWMRRHGTGPLVTAVLLLGAFFALAQGVDRQRLALEVREVKLAHRVWQGTLAVDAGHPHSQLLAPLRHVARAAAEVQDGARRFPLHQPQGPGVGGVGNPALRAVAGGAQVAVLERAQHAQVVHTVDDRRGQRGPGGAPAAEAAASAPAKALGAVPRRGRRSKPGLWTWSSKQG